MMNGTAANGHTQIAIPGGPAAHATHMTNRGRDGQFPDTAGYAEAGGCRRNHRPRHRSDPGDDRSAGGPSAAGRQPVHADVRADRVHHGRYRRLPAGRTVHRHAAADAGRAGRRLRLHRAGRGAAAADVSRGLYAHRPVRRPSGQRRLDVGVLARRLPVLRDPGPAGTGALQARSGGCHPHRAVDVAAGRRAGGRRAAAVRSRPRRRPAAGAGAGGQQRGHRPGDLAGPVGAECRRAAAGAGKGACARCSICGWRSPRWPASPTPA